MNINYTTGVISTDSFFDFGFTYGDVSGFGLFSGLHFVWLAACALVVASLCVLYKKSEDRIKIRHAVGISLISLELLRAGVLIVCGQYTRWSLPLHLCGMAVYISFFHSLRPRRLTGQFLYAFCMPGAMFALVFPDWAYYPAVHFVTVSSFLLHALIVSYTLMQVISRDIRPSIKDAPKCLAVMLIIAVPVYIFNKLAGTNYMFLNWPSPGSPLEWFAFLGKPGYILGYFPILAAVWTLIYCKL